MDRRATTSAWSGRGGADRRCAGRSCRPSRPTIHAGRGRACGSWRVPSRARLYEGAAYRTPIHRAAALDRARDQRARTSTARRQAAYASRPTDPARHAAGFRYLEAERHAGAASRVPQPAGRGAADPRRLASRPATSRVRTLAARRHRRSQHLAAAAVCRPQLRRLQPVRHRHAVQRLLRRQLRAAGVLGAVARPAAAGSWPDARSAIASSYNDRAFVRRARAIRPRHPAASGAGRVGVAAAAADVAAARCASGTTSNYTRLARSEVTAPAFVVPADQIAHGLRLGLDAQRAGWEASAGGRARGGAGWRAWGRPASDDYRCADATSSASARSLRAPRPVSPRVVARIEAAAMGGHDLDRFSRFAFGTFDNRLHGYPSALIRYDRGAVARRRARVGGSAAGARRWLRRHRVRARPRLLVAACAVTPASARRVEAPGAVRHAGRGGVGLRDPGRERRRPPRHARRAGHRATKSSDGFDQGDRHARSSSCGASLRQLGATARCSPRSRRSGRRRPRPLQRVVVDKQGTPITGLTADDFEIVEEGKPQTITFFAEGYPETATGGSPLHLGLRSTPAAAWSDDINDVRTAAIKFLNANEHAVDITLVDFDTEVRVARFGAGGLPAPDRAHPHAQARRLDGALRRRRRVPRTARREQDGQKILAHLHRRRRHAQLDDASRPARPRSRRPT